jgi:hypothetical protein
MTLSCGTPSDLISAVQASAEAPAPFTTTLMSLRLRLVSRQALMSPAAAMIAVPCWSSCITGMFMRSRKVCSITKHSGALISSRLMPPNEGSIMAMASISASGSSLFSSMSIDRRRRSV